MWPPDASRQRNGGSTRSRRERERRDVPAQVVDGRERQPARPGDRLARGEAHEQRADQPRALRRRDERDLVERDRGVLERRLDDGADELEVPARGHLRHDPAEALVQLRLRAPDRRSHDELEVDHRGARVVAGGLDRQDQRSSGTLPGGWRHMISASSRLSV